MGVLDKVLDFLKLSDDDYDDDDFFGEDDYEEEKPKKNIFKREKKYDLADRIRGELEEKKVIIKDTREGTIYEVQKWTD